jgi:hypothetical protein
LRRTMLDGDGKERGMHDTRRGCVTTQPLTDELLLPAWRSSMRSQVGAHEVGRPLPRVTVQWMPTKSALMVPTLLVPALTARSTTARAGSALISAPLWVGRHGNLGMSSALGKQVATKFLGTNVCPASCCSTLK